MRKKHRILMATDVPFWRNQTGAQQRMFHLVLGLASNEFGDKACEVVTFFIGVASPDDQQLAKSKGLDVRFHSADIAPDGIRKRIKWHMDGTIHLIRQTFRGRPESNKVEQPLKLKDFHWQWAIDAFAKCVDELEPETALIQYVTMSNLLSGLSESQRAKMKCVVDTHDILSSRQDQFEQFGFAHWIDIDREEECKCLSKFDAALSITDLERPTFQDMAPDVEILTVGHSLSPVMNGLKKPDSQSASNEALLTVGYFGSSNHSNGHALVKFIRSVWQPIREQSSEIRLVIAGGICDWLMFHEESRFSSDESMSLWIELSTDPNVELMGKIDEAAFFYNKVDVVINPVEFGTGLKIKTSEACAYGVPSVITQHCADAIPPAAADAVVICDSIQQMLPALFSLSLDQQRVCQLKESAWETAKEQFSDVAVYSGLINWLHGS